MKLKAVKVPDKLYTYKNVLVHNIIDFENRDECYVKLNDVIYKSVAGKVEKGEIGIGMLHRNVYQICLKDMVDIELYNLNLQRGQSKKLNLQIRFYKKSDKMDFISIHEETFKEELIKNFNDFYFSQGQELIYKYQGYLFILKVTEGQGLLRKLTICKFITDELNLNIVSSELLKPDLFRDDYNFEEIGIGGLNSELVNIFRRSLSTRAVPKNIVDKLGIKHVKGILLYGPPGTGKTLIARNIGKLLTENKPKIINGPEVLNKYVGESEKNIREIFSEAETDKQRNGKNSKLHVIIFDEIDAICKKRGRSGSVSTNVNDTIVNQLLTKMDGVDDSCDNFFIIAMTNRKDLLDDALLRPGRLGVHIEIKLPDLEGRRQIYRIHISKMQINNMMSNNVDINQLAELTKNFSGAEIEETVKNAASCALHEILNQNNNIKEEDVQVKMEHFVKAIQEITPAFGQVKNTIISLIPKDFNSNFTDTYGFVYQFINNYLKDKKRLSKFLIYGPNFCGKTSLISKIALESNYNFIRLVRPIDVVSMDDYSKSNYLMNILRDAYLSESSLILFDDVEILINYAELSCNVSFSNILHQTLMTILKTYPENRLHSLSLICTTSSPNLYNQLKDSFNNSYKL